MGEVKKSPKEEKQAKEARQDGGRGNSTWVLISLLTVIIAIAGGIYTSDSDNQIIVTGKQWMQRVLSGEEDKLPDKYATDLVKMPSRHFVGDLQCQVDFTPEVLSKDGFVHVKDAMASPPKDDSSVFFMLNGRNEGVYVSWNGDLDCIGLSSKVAAKWLGADQDVMANGVRLYSQMGHPIRSAEGLVASKRLVHILLDFQLWQWPGIEKGYKYHLEDGVVMTTVGMRPKVFDVEFFLTQDEADKIIDIGMPTLNRSRVDGTNSSRVTSKSRTSHTAFLPDSHFTRDFRRRSTSLARLPLPAHAERVQLVRYEAGEFYRKHLDTFHSRDFLPKKFNEYNLDDYRTWAAWAHETLQQQDQARVPEEFREGQALHPDPDSAIYFPNALLQVFHDDANASNWFVAHDNTLWGQWLHSNLANNASGILNVLLNDDKMPHYLPYIVKAWERKLHMPELLYTFPKKRPNGVSQFFTWTRWAKERVNYLGDQIPEEVRTTGELYPKFTHKFQTKLLNLVLDDYSKDFLSRMMTEDWYDWLVTNRARHWALWEGMKVYPSLAELAIKSWEARVGHEELRYKLPKYVKHFHPQRYVTLFLYLNNQTKVGGETVFPYSLDRFSDDKIERKGMDECSSGLAVPPRGLHASLFYVQTPEGDIDYMSRHGGCPPHEGIKWGANSFMWNEDADEGADLWTTK